MQRQFHFAMMQPVDFHQQDGGTWFEAPDNWHRIIHLFPVLEHHPPNTMADYCLELNGKIRNYNFIFEGKFEINNSIFGI